MVFTLVKEDRFARADRLINATRAAHLSRPLEYGDDMGEGRGMPLEPTAWLESKDRCLDKRPLFGGCVNGAMATPSSRSPRGTNATSGAKLNRSTRTSMVEQSEGDRTLGETRAQGDLAPRRHINPVLATTQARSPRWAWVCSSGSSDSCRMRS